MIVWVNEAVKQQMIEFKNVTKKYTDNIGIDNVSLKIDNGEFVFIIGESGAGKSTFIRLIEKEIAPDTGHIYFDGKEITHLKRREIPAIRQSIGMVFQDFRLLDKKTAFENVSFAMEILHRSKREIARRVPEVLDLVGLHDKGNKYPNELSAGEQQRVGIARAIANKPRVLICDEPTGNLDYKTAKGIMDILEKINMRGTTVIVATHALDLVKEMNKRVITIAEGKVVNDRMGLFNSSDHFSNVNYIDELVRLFENSGSLTSEERRTIYMTETNVGRPGGQENVEVFIGDYLKQGDENE